ncbi:class F sortase [Actinocatenispora thailandica]|nr:class F sortase [Actinocatenispora thailandica]
MSARRRRHGHGLGWPVAAAGMALTVVAAGCGSTAGNRTAPANGPSDGPPRSPHPTASALPLVDAQAADPIRIRVPGVGIDAPIGPLRVGADGVLPPPRAFDRAGWWQAGPEPGERGPAVIVGHVDSYRGPAVFFRLSTIADGARIFVDRADGSTAVFAEQRIERRAKTAFPTKAVYGSTSDSELRVITCGGRFDRRKRSYRDNVIVFARRVR